MYENTYIKDRVPYIMSLYPTVTCNDAYVYFSIQCGWDDYITGDVSDYAFLNDKWYIWGRQAAIWADEANQHRCGYSVHSGR